MGGLPSGGAFHRALDPHGWNWSNTEELLASLIELADVGNLMYFRAHVPAGTRAPDPVHVRRPWQTVETPKPATVEEMKKFFKR